MLLEVLLSPLTLTSFVLLQLWAIATSKQQHISITAIAPLFFRWLLHIQGIRPDIAAHHLISNLPVLNPPALVPALNSALCWGSVGPTLFASNLTGYTPSFLTVPAAGKENIGNMIHTRTLFFDKALAKNLTAVKQVVLLGAGFDTRLLKFCANQGLALFEIDQSETQQIKIETLQKSGVALDDITFVSVDFNREDWAVKLLQAGFETDQPTFFLWEGVTYYLSETTVKANLLKMANISGTGSAIAFDVFSSSFISASGEWIKIRPFVHLLSLFGEPFRFGMAQLDDMAIAHLLNAAGLQVQAMQRMGDHSGTAFGALVSAVKQAP